MGQQSGQSNRSYKERPTAALFLFSTNQLGWNRVYQTCLHPRNDLGKSQESQCPGHTPGQRNQSLPGYDSVISILWTPPVISACSHKAEPLTRWLFSQAACLAVICTCSAVFLPSRSCVQLCSHRNKLLNMLNNQVTGDNIPKEGGPGFLENLVFAMLGYRQPSVEQIGQSWALLQRSKRQGGGWGWW